MFPHQRGGAGHIGFSPVGVGVRVGICVVCVTEPTDEISQNLHGYITGTGLRTDYILVSLTSFEGHRRSYLLEIFTEN